MACDGDIHSYQYRYYPPTDRSYERCIGLDWCSACREYSGAMVHVPRGEHLADALAGLPAAQRERLGRSETKLLDHLDRLARRKRVMTYFADLSPYTYLEASPDAGTALNVGWLDSKHVFPRGPVPAGFVESLAALCATGQMNLTRGWHRCNLGGCAHPDRPVARSGVLGFAEVRVEGADGKVYAAPTLIHHYVVEHGYRPPEEFVAAVLDQSTHR